MVSKWEVAAALTAAYWSWSAHWRCLLGCRLLACYLVSSVRLCLISGFLGSVFSTPALRARLSMEQGIWKYTGRFALGSTPWPRASSAAQVSWNNKCRPHIAQAKTISPCPQCPWRSQELWMESVRPFGLGMGQNWFDLHLQVLQSAKGRQRFLLSLYRFIKLSVSFKQENQRLLDSVIITWDLGEEKNFLSLFFPPNWEILSVCDKHQLSTKAELLPKPRTLPSSVWTGKPNWSASELASKLLHPSNLPGISRPWSLRRKVNLWLLHCFWSPLLGRAGTCHQNLENRLLDSCGIIKRNQGWALHPASMP